MNDNEYSKEHNQLQYRHHDFGFGVYNLLNQDNAFIPISSRVVTLSFELNDIEEIDGTEILKLLFFNGLTVRIMKYFNDKEQAVAIFDIVEENKKILVAKIDREFVRGIGIAEIFYDLKMITQWEIPILLKLCVGFVHGDIDTYRTLIKEYHLKISKNSEWYLRMKLGLM